MSNLPFKLNQHGTRVDRSNFVLTCGKNGCTFNHYHFECTYLKKLGYTTEITPDINKQVAEKRVTDKRAYYPRIKKENQN